MKSLLSLSVAALLFAVPLIGQTAPANAAPHVVNSDAPHLAVFDLDFPGGTPSQLVAAIEKSSGRPLNTVIPVEYSNHQLPPLKLRHVNTSDLFVALGQTEVVTPDHRYIASFLNKKDPSRVTDDDIWTFFVQSVETVRTMNQESTSRFYLLKPYIDAGLTVDDITTAVQTAWKLNRKAEAPALSYHKETGLLIAVGDPTQVSVIDAVLIALEPLKNQRKVIPPAAETKKN